MSGKRAFENGNPTDHVSTRYEFSFTLKIVYPVDTGRKLNVHKTFRRRPGRLMYVQFTFCVYGVTTSHFYKKAMQCESNLKKSKNLTDSRPGLPIKLFCCTATKLDNQRID